MPAQGQFAQQGPKLVGSGAVGQADQGYSVALSGDGNTAIIGGYGDHGNVGAAWVFTRNAGNWTQQGSKLVGSGAVGQADQGYSVALSGDGNTAIVGGAGDNNSVGAAWVFTRNAGNWTQQGSKLVGSGAVKVAFQGTSVALSEDGNTAILGGIGIGDNGYPAAAAWVFTRSGGAWTQQGPKLVGSGAVGNAYGYVEQGTSVALSGDGNTAIVGGPADNKGVGAAWVFTRNAGNWTQQGSKLVGSGAIGQAAQGTSVALSGDGNTAILGGPQDIGGAGAVWLFTRIAAGAWGQQGGKLSGSGVVSGGTLGISAALSEDGNTAIVGGPFDNNDVGAAWVFTRPPGAGVIGSVISAVVNAASFQAGIASANGVSFQPGIASNTWITIQGTNLSPTTDTWGNAIANGNLPTSLDGVSVELNVGGGVPLAAYTGYVSPNQINFLCPDLPGFYISSGEWGQPVAVSVSGPAGGSNAFTVWDYGVGGGAELLQPAFFLWPGGYAVATRQDFSWAAKNGTFPRTPTVPAKPGDILILWGTGFGPTNPPAPVGILIPPGTILNTVNPVTVTVGGHAAVVYGAALTPGAAGLYQVAIQVPLSLANGDYPVVASIYNSQSPPALITIQQ